ncbi:MAG TPA: thioredoxin domain-containing protein [Candidatus Acidoferrum sp.]|nr:thioredoxin domain-containing protein [Candidatus Acidoferrum sp.]
MNRRAILAVLALVGLIGVGLQVSRGLSPALAARFNVDRAPAGAPKQPAAPTNGLTAQPSRSPARVERSVESAPQPPAPQSPIGLPDIDPHKAFGSKSAPVTMEVFSDFQCPACKTLFTTTNRRLMDDYVTTGKVYLIHRDFPLAMHAYSRVAARYARAAAQLGKVEPVEQALFQNQEKWEQSGDVDGTVAAVLSPAEMIKVRALVKGGTLDPLIDRDFSLGQNYRVNQTPTTVFHCKGQTYPYSGVMTYDVLKTFLEQLLSQK